VVPFTARKLRQWPPEAGTSCLGEECRNDEVLEVALRLFRGVPYCGLGYLEMKRDRRTGRHWIIEPNIGRPTWRSSIAEAAGVELLYANYCEAVGRPLSPGLEQRYGNTKWIYWRLDLQSAFHYWRKGELTLRDWRRSWRGLTFDAVFGWSDAAPFWADLWRCAGTLLRRSASRSSAAPVPRPLTGPGEGALAASPPARR
jgi:predicted ATP-grasp superfamily ATP-dependent carboligase